MESLQQQEQQQQQHSNQTNASQLPNDNVNTAEVVLLNRVSAEIERMRTAPTSSSSSSSHPTTTATTGAASVSASSTTTTTSSSLLLSTEPRYFHSFPPACLEMLKSIKGNHRCVDCGEQNPQWAACRYGALLCLNCSGHHRSLGVQVSSVRSISMDEWSVTEVISMLEGGNSQLTAFFDRHALTQQACPPPTGDPSNRVCDANGRDRSTTTAATAPTSMINRENVMRLRYKTKAALFYRMNMEQHVNTILATGPYRGREISRQNYKANVVL
jgi:Putative GTPase activating protein for Arf